MRLLTVAATDRSTELEGRRTARSIKSTDRRGPGQSKAVRPSWQEGIIRAARENRERAIPMMVSGLPLTLRVSPRMSGRLPSRSQNA